MKNAAICQGYNTFLSAKLLKSLLWRHSTAVLWADFQNKAAQLRKLLSALTSDSYNYKQYTGVNLNSELTFAHGLYKTHQNQ